MADVTATGWKGLDLPDVLDALASHAGDSLEGSILHLDKVDKVRIAAGADGNSVEAKFNLQSSFTRTARRSAGHPVCKRSGPAEHLARPRDRDRCIRRPDRGGSLHRGFGAVGLDAGARRPMG